MRLPEGSGYTSVRWAASCIEGGDIKTRLLTRETHVLVWPIFGTGQCMALQQIPGAVSSFVWESAAGASNRLFFLRGTRSTKNKTDRNVCVRRITELASHNQWARIIFACRKISKSQQLEAVNSRGDQRPARNFVGHLSARSRARAYFYTPGGKVGSRDRTRWSLGYTRAPFSLSVLVSWSWSMLLFGNAKEMCQGNSLNSSSLKKFILERSMSFVSLPSKSQPRTLLPFGKKV